VSEFISKSVDVPQVDTHWASEAGIIDIFVMFGPKPNDVFRQYGKLTGNTPLPPVSLSNFKLNIFYLKISLLILFKLFSIAYHQCRWNYNDEHDVKK
jgi:mannosyl-oligosaccharide alpha-1,3-glucosidase